MEKPSWTTYTIYSKSNCAYCDKVKLLLKDEVVNVIECDEYLAEDRTRFLQTMHHYSGVECKTFPMVFLKGIYIGGFAETKKYYNSLIYTNLDF